MRKWMAESASVLLEKFDKSALENQRKELTGDGQKLKMGEMISREIDHT